MVRLFLLLLLLLPGSAWADAFSSVAPATQPDGTTISISGGKLTANNTGCSTNCTFTTPTITGGTVTITATGSSAARSAADRFGEVINALDKGVVCDGSTDNATAYAAIRTATQAKAGQTVYFPPSALACLSSTNLNLSSNTTYFAYPGTVTLKPATGSTSNPLLMQAASVSNVKVSGFIFDGGGVDFTSSNNLITVFTADGVVFDNIIVQNTNGVGLVLSTSITNSGVRNSKFTNVGNHWITTGRDAPGATDQKQGIAFCCGPNANSHGNFVTGSYFTNIGIDAISIANNNDFLADHNTFLSVGGLYANGGAAIYMSNNNAATVTNNNVVGTFGNGLDLISTPNAVINGNNVEQAGGSGISYAMASHASITGNQSRNNNQGAGASALQSGLSFNGNTTAVTDVTVSGNNFDDTQGSPTQTWGIQEYTGGTYTNVFIDQNNSAVNNVTGPFGQVLSAYSPLKVSATVLGFQQSGVAPNQGAELAITGTGFFSATVPDSTVTGGNTPGNQSISLSVCRSAANQVASAANSALVGGCNNVVSGQYAVAIGGEWNIASGPGCMTLGLFANCEFRAGTLNIADGEFASQGDAQSVFATFHKQSTSATPVTLTSDGGAGGNANQANVGVAAINIKHSLRGRLLVTGRSAADIKEWACDFLTNSGNGVATVVLVGSTCTSTWATGGAAAWTFALTVDTANGGLVQTATGAAATTINWTSSLWANENGSL